MITNRTPATPFTISAKTFFTALIRGNVSTSPMPITPSRRTP
jgi:hypothetical protein